MSRVNLTSYFQATVAGAADNQRLQTADGYFSVEPGRFLLALSGTLSAGTLKLQWSPDDGTTKIDLLELGSMTTLGARSFDATRGTLYLDKAGGGAGDSVLAWCSPCRHEG